MGLEAASFLDDLVTSNPVSSDTVAQGDDHLRLLKSVLKATFPGLDRAIYLEKAIADLASATSPDLGGTTTNYVNITGTTTITSFANGEPGMQKLLRFAGALTLTYHAANLILPTAADIVTVAGDHAIAVCTASGVWRIVAYFRATGRAVSELFTGSETQVTAASGDKLFLLDVSDSETKHYATAQSIAETARATMMLVIFDDENDCVTGDGASNLFVHIPAWMDGFNLVAVSCSVKTNGTGSSMLIQVHNVTQGTDYLSSKLTLAAATAYSSTATIDTVNDDVATGNILRIDVDQVHTTPAKGLCVELTFARP